MAGLRKMWARLEGHYGSSSDNDFSSHPDRSISHIPGSRLLSGASDMLARTKAGFEHTRKRPANCHGGHGPAEADDTRLWGV